MTTNGRKEITEAVLIAALTAAATAFINFGVDELKKHVAKKQATTSDVKTEEVKP